MGMPTAVRMKSRIHAIALLLIAALPSAGQEPATLDRGYRLMYSFEFDAVAHELQRWRGDHPDNALGPASQAANLLVSELARLGILEAQFFADDRSFTSRKRPLPDRELRVRYDRELDAASRLAAARLAIDGTDRDALLAMTLVLGLRADHAALIEKRNLASLSYTRDGARWATRLLQVAPDCADAYLATGISDYIVGSLIAPVRWLLRIGGYTGDTAKGIEQLKITAARGRLLAPLARILLSIAYIRQGDRVGARETLAGLSREFPSNTLFYSEIQRLDSGHQ
jgi:hypothetical protein